MKPCMSYALVTPARNEAALIEQTIRSMLAQTHRPVRWVIVSDGSTDATDDIVRRYTTEHAWIELVRMPERAQRHFAGKVNAFRAGHARLAGVEHDVIGNLDADLSFGADHFEYLLRQFEAHPRLGVAGTPFREGDVQYDFRFTNIEHVSGACQLFRRECFEEIGGYRPIKAGGIDWVAVTTARMRGWQTRTFVERHVSHHRAIGTAEQGALKARFRLGRKDYALGGHPLWELSRGLYQMGSRPRVLGGLSLLAGYTWALLTRCERPVDAELMAFHRREQMQRLRRFVRRGPARAQQPS